MASDAEEKDAINTVPVTVLVGGKTLTWNAQRGETLTRVMQNLGHPLNTRCAGRGICSSCTVDLVQGRVLEGDRGTPIGASGGPQVVRACQSRVEGPCHIHVPERSLLFHKAQVVVDYQLGVGWKSRAIEPGEVGCAVDVGTTTVAVILFETSTGRILARTAGFNKQMRYGDDVLTRINLCAQDTHNVERLGAAIRQHTLRPLIHEAQMEIGGAAISSITVAGNTTMLHLLAGEDPTSMGMLPFTPRFLEHRVLDAGELGIGAAGVRVHLVPGASAYVGADIVAGVVSSGMNASDGPCMLVDVGTNGEIVLKHGKRLVCCATAAGPAFEGSRLLSGMRAVEGAISHLKLSPKGEVTAAQVIGGLSAERGAGLCGTAYVDFLAEGRIAGILTETGRFETDAIRPELLTSDPEHRQILSLGGKARVCETDVAALLQAKGAVAAGIETLLRREGLTSGDVKRLYLAGGFGMHMQLASAIRCGLLPGFKPEQVELVGNTSLGGAYLAGLDRERLGEMEAVAKAMETLELNLDPGFEDSYISQLSLP